MVTKRNIKIYCDGGARGNPGPAAYSFIVFENEKVIYKKSRFLGRRTNNFAEYSGVLAALEWLIKKSAGLDNVSIFLDSQLVVKQLSGEYKVKSNNLKPLITEIKLLEENMETKINFYFLPRDKNKLADFLVNKTLDKNRLIKT
jgi:ribonuclease HI